MTSTEIDKRIHQNCFGANVTSSRQTRIQSLMSRVEEYNLRTMTYASGVVRKSTNDQTFLEILDYVPKARAERKANRPYALYLGYALAQSSQSASVDLTATIPLSAAVELANCTITYIYDRIIDDDEEVSGTLSLHRKYGVSLALLAGDALTSVARKIVLGCVADHKNALHIIEEFEQIFFDCDYGQFLDVTFGERESARQEDAETINDARTGQFIRRASEIGALYAGVDDDTHAIIHEAFHYYGRAVQDANDLADVVPRANMPGSKYQDIYLWKKTKPLIFALEMVDKGQRADLQHVLGNPEATTDQLYDASRIVEQCGAFARAEADLETTIEKGMQVLQRLPESDIRQETEIYFDYVRCAHKITL